MKLKRTKDMNDYKFDIFFNHSQEDTYLVQYLSQTLRDTGHTTFDRSVDEYPQRKIDCITEDEALDSSRVMVLILTENSYEDPSVQNLAALAIAEKKPIIIADFASPEIPEKLKGYPTIKCSREEMTKTEKDLKEVLKKI